MISARRIFKLGVDRDGCMAAGSGSPFWGLGGSGFDLPALFSSDSSFDAEVVGATTGVTEGGAHPEKQNYCSALYPGSMSTFGKSWLSKSWRPRLNTNRTMENWDWDKTSAILEQQDQSQEWSLRYSWISWGLAALVASCILYGVSYGAHAKIMLGSERIT